MVPEFLCFRVKQIKEREERLEEMGRVASQPLARYEGDEDLEAHLKDQMLKDDPMFAYIHQKRVQEGKIVQSLFFVTIFLFFYYCFCVLLFYLCFVL